MTVDYAAIAPEIALSGTALVVLFLDLFLKGEAKRFTNIVSLLGTITAIVFTVMLWNDPRVTFDGMFVVNNYAVLFKLIFLGTLVSVLALSYHYFSEGRYFQGEYYFLLVIAFVGMLLMPSARDLVLLFVALETVSVPGFVMAGLRKRNLYSSEAAIKFFLIGVLSVSVMLFGLSFIYGFTGTTSLVGVSQALAGQAGAPSPLLLGSMLLVIVGFAFKVSAVPFHFWAPDTYAGSPLPVTAMLAVASKAAGFAGLVAVTFGAFGPMAEVWAPVMGVLSVVTMTVGNLVALQQRDIVRLLAYSSVAQAGYMLLPFGLARSGGGEVNATAIQAVLFYLMAYAVMNAGAFAVVIAVYRKSRKRAVSDYAGLGYRSPLLAVAMTVFMLSLGGAPLTVGLWAKLFIFKAAVTGSGYVLAGAMVLNTVIAMFYYLHVVKTMWFEQPVAGAPKPKPSFTLVGAASLLMLATFALGVYPEAFSKWAVLTTTSP